MNDYLHTSEVQRLAIPSTQDGKCNTTVYSSCKEYEIDWNRYCDDKNCTENQMDSEIINMRKENFTKSTQLCSSGYVWDNSVFKSTVVTDFNVVDH